MTENLKDVNDIFIYLIKKYKMLKYSLKYVNFSGYNTAQQHLQSNMWNITENIKFYAKLATVKYFDTLSSY